jgi:hypothetical protein
METREYLKAISTYSSCLSEEEKKKRMLLRYLHY